MMVIFLFLLGVLSYVLVGIYRSYALKQDILDYPNHRSSHVLPTSLGGGVIFPVLWFAFLLILYFVDFIELSYLVIFIFPVFLIVVVSFLDDRYGLSAYFRFLAQLTAAIYSLIVIGGLPSIDLGFMTLNWGWFGYIFAVFALVWSANLFNFMDGIDGIAALEALFVFGFGGYFIWCSGGNEFAVIVWSMCVIVLGFLLWNKPPAKIIHGRCG